MNAKRCPLSRDLLYDEAGASGKRADVLSCMSYGDTKQKFPNIGAVLGKFHLIITKDIRPSLAIMRRWGTNAKYIPIEGTGIYCLPRTEVRPE